MIEDYLRSRIRRPLPKPYLDILDETGGLTRKGLDDSVHKLDTRCIYTTEALTLSVDQCLLIDFRFVDFVLDLIAASEEDDELRALSVTFAIYAFVVEQTLRYPDSHFKQGALLDFLVSRMSATSLYGLKPRGEHDPGRLEYVAKLVVAHEAGHAWLAVDDDYKNLLVGNFSGAITSLESAIASNYSPGGRLIHTACVDAQRLLAKFQTDGVMEEDFEELLCDYVMVQSGADAVVATPEHRSHAFTYFSLTHSTLVCLWFVPIIRKIVESLFCASTQVAVNPGFIRDTRSVLALGLFMRRTGIAIAEGKNEEMGRIVELWQATADFENMCVTSFDQIMSHTNLERLNVLGEFAEQSGLGFSGGTRNAILKLLGWR